MLDIGLYNDCLPSPSSVLPKVDYGPKTSILSDHLEAFNYPSMKDLHPDTNIP